MPEIPDQIEQGTQVYFDNELVRLLSTITTDEFTPHLISFIQANKFTPRAKNKLITFLRQILDREYALTKLDSSNGGRDFLMLRDRLHILKAEFPLGLTKYDMSPEAQWVLSNIDMKWLAKIYRSKGGFERIRLQTDRHEYSPQMTPEEIEKKEAEKKRWFGLGRG